MRSASPIQPASPLTWGRNRLPVPYVAAWTTETPSVGGALTIRPRGGGLAYRDEEPADRDRHGVLWSRVPHAPGVGKPDFRVMHPGRQRRAMLHRLCQVCGGPASHTSRGWLFLTQRPESTELSAAWPEGALSAKPPVCESCAHLAVRYCPHLTDPVLLRVRKPRVWGVFGGFLMPTGSGRLASFPADDCLSYGHPAACWFLASQLLVELTRCAEASVPCLRSASRFDERIAS